MDWDKVDFPDIKNRAPQSGALSTLDYWKLVIASKILRKSVRGIVQTAIACYLARNWAAHEERLGVEAKRLGIRPEELFERLARDKGELEK